MSKKLKNQWSLDHNFMTGVTFGIWLKVLAENRFYIAPAYWHRGVVITLASIANSGFAVIEKLRFGKAIKQAEIPKAPVFVLGHWRSGTTFLHELLAQDDTQFQYANTYRVVNPLTFLTTERFITKALAGLVPPKRPMDNMELKFSSPQEDELAPLLMTRKSLYLGMSFPRNTDFYDKYLSFRDVDRAEIEKWKAAFLAFSKKLMLNDKRTLLLKSPAHTARIRIILEMFPDARFVHIHRDPYKVFQSQRHFFDTAGWFTYLQRPIIETIDEGILKRHETMYDAYFEDLPLVPKDRICELNFVDLETDPAGSIKEIYDSLSLNGYDEFAPKLERYVDSLKGYEKNDFGSLNNADKKMVAKHWKRSFETWGYSMD